MPGADTAAAVCRIHLTAFRATTWAQTVWPGQPGWEHGATLPTPWPWAALGMPKLASFDCGANFGASPTSPLHLRGAAQPPLLSSIELPQGQLRGLLAVTPNPTKARSGGKLGRRCGAGCSGSNRCPTWHFTLCARPVACASAASLPLPAPPPAAANVHRGLLARMAPHARPLWAVVLVAALLLAAGPSAAQVGPAHALEASF